MKEDRKESQKVNGPKTQPSRKKAAKGDRQDKKPKKVSKGLWVALAASIVVLCGSIYALLSTIRVTSEEVRDRTVDYGIDYIDDDTMEMGTQVTEKEGSNGQRHVYYKVVKRLLTGEVVSERYQRSEEISKPVNAVVRRGTRKWQYMYCSDGGYRYYTDEQFAQPNIGFTSASEDSCAKNGQGAKTQLADAPPLTQGQGYSVAVSPAPAADSSQYAEWSAQLEQWRKEDEEWLEKQREWAEEDERRQESAEKMSEYMAEVHKQEAQWDEEQRQAELQQQAAQQEAEARQRAEEEARRQAQEQAEREANEQRKLAAQGACRTQAEMARESVLRQLGVTGTGNASYYGQEAYNSTYNECLRSKGF